MTTLPSKIFNDRSGNRLLLIGSGGHARAIIDSIESTSDWRIVGLVGEAKQIGGTVLGYPVLGCDDHLDRLRNLSDAAILALGHLGCVTKTKRMDNIRKNPAKHDGIKLSCRIRSLVGITEIDQRRIRKEIEPARIR